MIRLNSYKTCSEGGVETRFLENILAIDKLLIRSISRTDFTQRGREYQIKMRKLLLEILKN